MLGDIPSQAQREPGGGAPADKPGQADKEGEGWPTGNHSAPDPPPTPLPFPHPSTAVRGLPGAGGCEGTIFCFAPLPLQVPTRAPPVAWPQQLHPRARERRRGTGRAHKGPSALPGAGGHILQAPPAPQQPRLLPTPAQHPLQVPLCQQLQLQEPRPCLTPSPNGISKPTRQHGTPSSHWLFHPALWPGASPLITHGGPGPRALPGALTPVPQWLSAHFPFRSPSCHPASTRDHVHPVPVPVPLPLPHHQAH